MCNTIRQDNIFPSALRSRYVICLKLLLKQGVGRSSVDDVRKTGVEKMKRIEDYRITGVDNRRPRQNDALTTLQI